MAKVYVALCEDRHIDPVIHVFTLPERAIDYCKRWTKENALHPDDIEEYELTDDMRAGGWIYAATYSGEGDHVTAMEMELDPVGEIGLDNAL